ncbi:hypothetical protein PMO31116_03586 [Pandoraea morbifera]|uniref:Uncharacterized protein n=2 Tax=Pandoraea morbifera TaxID=2508300 RepID=A0A5E4X2Q3_9BURK|nr:hypothetical protein PMO31116_03586 [Pandoraea morbifera]
MLAVADAKANGNLVVRASNGQMFAVDPADSQILSGDPNLKAMLLEAQKGSAFGAILSALIIASGGSTETALEGAQLGQAVEGVGAGVTSFGTPRTALPVEVKPGNATNKGPLTIAEQMGILREAAAGGSLGKGNFGPGQATAADSNKLGEAWVGPGYRILSDGSSWVSSDGLRVYRPPSEKPNSSYATTGVQANFEAKLTAGSRPISNGHLNITP